MLTASSGGECIVRSLPYVCTDEQQPKVFAELLSNLSCDELRAIDMDKEREWAPDHEETSAPK